MDKTFLKGLILLEAMAKNDKSSGVTELANQLGLHKSNVHRLLQGLVHQGFARRNSETSRYELTMKLWELGARVFNRLDVRQEALPFMKELADETQETVHLSVLNGTDVLYIEKIDSPQPVRAYTIVGGRAPAQCVATGKVMLAWADQEILDQIIPKLAKHTPLSIVSKTELLQEMEAIRAQGYAVNRGEWREQVMGLAAPIYDVSGAVVAAMGISGPSERLTQIQIEKMGQSLIHLTGLISRRLGYYVSR